MASRILVAAPEIEVPRDRRRRPAPICHRPMPPGQCFGDTPVKEPAARSPGPLVHERPHELVVEVVDVLDLIDESGRAQFFDPRDRFVLRAPTGLSNRVEAERSTYCGGCADDLCSQLAQPPESGFKRVAHA